MIHRTSHHWSGRYFVSAGLCLSPEQYHRSPPRPLLDLHEAQARKAALSTGGEKRYRFRNFQLGSSCSPRLSESSPGLTEQHNHRQGAVWERSEELPQAAVQLPHHHLHFLVLQISHITLFPLGFFSIQFQSVIPMSVIM